MFLNIYTSVMFSTQKKYHSHNLKNTFKQLIKGKERNKLEIARPMGKCALR